jgi:hypothetical protein
MRQHGIEIECLLRGIPDVHTRCRTVVDALQAAGIDATVASHGEEGYRRWQVEPDGSLYAASGVEIVSPRLTDPTFAELRTVCTVLAGLGATVDKTCGLHVHMDARDLTEQQGAAIALAYDVMLPEIEALLPSSRRSAINQWAAPAAGGTMRGLPDIRPALAKAAAGGTLTAREQANVFGETGERTHYGPSRYRAVSLIRMRNACDPANRTVEFRSHSGTVDFDKIRSWVVILDNFVKNTLAALETAATDATEEPAVPAVGIVPERHTRARAPRIVKGGTKVQQFVDRCQNGTATFEWCATALDWDRDNTQSWASYVRAWGYPLRSIKLGRQVLGYTMETTPRVVKRLQLTPETVRDVLKQDLKKGLPEEFQKYMDDRKAALAAGRRLSAALGDFGATVRRHRPIQPREAGTPDAER